MGGRIRLRGGEGKGRRRGQEGRKGGKGEGKEKRRKL
jgi:hypothetical protein